MKKKLLIGLFALMGVMSSAQTKIWDFGNDAATWPLSPGIGTEPMVVDNLGLFPIPTNTNFGAVNANNLTFGDGYSATRRFQMNGAGYPAGPFMAMPTQRYLFFGVSGSCTVKVWFRTGSNGAVRTMYVSDGNAAVGSSTTNSGGNGDFPILQANYTGGATTLYIYGDAACNLYKVEVTGATVSTTLSNNEFSKIDTEIYSIGKTVFLSNILTDTKIQVFAITGALIREFNTSNNTNFDIPQNGIYLIKAFSSEGQKTSKILIQ